MSTYGVSGAVNETAPRKPKWGEGGRQMTWLLDSEAIGAGTHPGGGTVSARESESGALRKSDVQAEAGSRRGSGWPKGAAGFRGAFQAWGWGVRPAVFRKRPEVECGPHGWAEGGPRVLIRPTDTVESPPRDRCREEKQKRAPLPPHRPPRITFQRERQGEQPSTK